MTMNDKEGKDKDATAMGIGQDHMYKILKKCYTYRNQEYIIKEKIDLRLTRTSNSVVLVPLSFTAIHTYDPESVNLRFLDQRSSRTGCSLPLTLTESTPSGRGNPSPLRHRRTGRR